MHDCIKDDHSNIWSLGSGADLCKRTALEAANERHTHWSIETRRRPPSRSVADLRESRPDLLLGQTSCHTENMGSHFVCRAQRANMQAPEQTPADSTAQLYKHTLSNTSHADKTKSGGSEASALQLNKTSFTNTTQNRREGIVHSLLSICLFVLRHVWVSVYRI